MQHWIIAFVSCDEILSYKVYIDRLIHARHITNAIQISRFWSVLDKDAFWCLNLSQTNSDLPWTETIEKGYPPHRFLRGGD